PLKTYPIKTRHGRRPRFLIESLAQESIGEHRLDSEYAIPAPINMFLRKYQREGVKFLFDQWKKGTGGLLGDDMGLGKTIMVIAFLSTIMRRAPAMGLHGVTGTRKIDKDARKRAVREQPDNEDGEGPKPSEYGLTCLIACPASVVHNWRREFETWTYLSVMVLDGKQKAEDLKYFEKGYVDAVIAGIEAVRNNIADLQHHDFSLVIVDEAHRLKNPKSRTTKALHEFPTPLRYGLTGTAIQNKLEEFWCILHWVVPGQVGTQGNWNLYVSRPLKFVQKIDASDDQLVRGRLRAAALVSSLLPNFWLRRTKAQVKLQLPKKTDYIVLCPLSDLQVKAYKRMLAHEDVQKILRYDEACECGRKDSDGLPFARNKCCFQDWHKLILKYITVFQKISNHLALIYPDNEDKITNPDKYNQDFELVRTVFPADHENRRRGAITSLDDTLCGKWAILAEMLEEWHARGDKVLIFSLSLKIIALLKERMEQTHYTFEYLDGSVPNDERMPRVDNFNKNPDVFAFLISTRAGGVGLNLTSANRVVIFDPNWNPSHDLQAMDRAYRYGQQRDVDVYRLVGAGTLEELIYNRQQYKRAQMGLGYEATAERRLYSGVEGEKDETGELWGVKNIFSFRLDESLTTKSIRACDMAELEFAAKDSGMAQLAEKGESKSKKGKKKGKKDDFEDDDVPSEEDEEEVVKRVFDPNGPKAATESQLDAERSKKVREEQARIANILAQGGAQTLVSDAVLGGSKAEHAKGLNAIQTAKDSKRRSSIKPKKDASDDDNAPSTVWDPLARGKSRSKSSKSTPTPTTTSTKSTHNTSTSSSTAKPKAKLEKSAPPATFSPSERDSFLSLAENMGIVRTTSIAQLIAPSGYVGEEGMADLVKELYDKSGPAYVARVKEILEQWLDERW
ncbi:RAD26-like SNF2 family DNA-dependent ATPase, partial [Pseudohyphozyma bogoriensis]